MTNLGETGWLASVAARRLLAAVDRDVAPVLVDDFLAAVLDDALGERRIELLADVDQRPGAGGVDQEDVDGLDVGIRAHRIGEEILEEELAHPGIGALGKAGADVGRDLDDVVLVLGAEVAVGAQRARHRGQVDAVAHHLVGAEHRIEEGRERPFGKDEVHVVGEVGLEHLVRAVDEVDVLDAVLLDERVELADRKVARLAAEALELGRDLRQHLLHVGRDHDMLAAQHGLEHGEALREAVLELADLRRLLFRDQPVHGERGHDGGAETDGNHHRQKEQADFTLHRRTKPSQAPPRRIILSIFRR